VRLSANAAFVVHVTTTGAEAAEIVRGWIEHISSGRSTRFGSVASCSASCRTLVRLIDARRFDPRRT
jgi:hypothetical protein